MLTSLKSIGSLEQKMPERNWRLYTPHILCGTRENQVVCIIKYEYVGTLYKLQW